MNFYKGEVSSLLGHNGAGKTTATFILVGQYNSMICLKMYMCVCDLFLGMLEPTSGKVTIEGLDNRIHIQDVRKILGFCPQYGKRYLKIYHSLMFLF